jgi:hypothetical protein
VSAIGNIPVARRALGRPLETRRTPESQHECFDRSVVLTKTFGEIATALSLSAKISTFLSVAFLQAWHFACSNALRTATPTLSGVR